MDRFVNKKIEQQTIYEIYRACRLCGAGGGYKMPIIQSIVNLDGCDVELRQKIRECVQIEVHQDDKMPPLICELCVDKVNDFYEFLEMCRQTNKRTRLRLGLPPQMLPLGAPDAGDCILGVTEPICVYDEDSNEPLSDKKTKVLKGGKVRKEPEKKEVKIVLTNSLGRGTRSAQRAASPPRLRRDRREEGDNVTLNRLQTRAKKSISPPPKSILKKGQDKKKAETPPPRSRLKRSRERDTKPELPAKKVKISLKPLPSKKPPARIASPKQDKSKEVACTICKQRCKTPQALMSHMKTHTVTFTNPKMTCNACQEWFRSAEETAAHHRRHRAAPYRCRRCGAAHRTHQAYDDHITNGKCLPWDEVPDLECPECWRFYPTKVLLDNHRCRGESSRPGGKCNKCGKKYAARKTLLTHACRTYAKKADLKVDPDIMAGLRPIQVRVAKCDPLLLNKKRGHYDVAAVPSTYGLDKSCVYPYSRLRIKSEPTDCMVTINDMDFGSYVHWDSDDSGDSDDDFMFAKKRAVQSLTACALRTIFSNKLLGKVPRKYRRVKMEKIINSTLESLSDLCIGDESSASVSENRDEKLDTSESRDEKLDASESRDEKRDTTVDTSACDDKDEDDLFPKQGNVTSVTNNDFDSIFNNDRMDSDGNGDRDLRNDSLVDNDKSSVSEDINDSNAISEAMDVSENNENNESVNNEIEAKDVEGNVSIDSKDENVTQVESNDRINDTELETSLKSDTNNDRENNEISQKEDNQDVEESTEAVEENSLVKEENEVNGATSDIKDTDTETHKQLEDKTDSDNVQNENTVTESTVRSNANEISEVSKANLDVESKDTYLDKESAESNVPSMESNLHKDAIESKGEEVSGIEDKDSKEVNDGVSTEIQNGDSIEDGNLNMDDLEDFGSDTELEDSKLMAEIDAQIGEKRTETDATERQKETVDEAKKDTDMINQIESEVSKKETGVSETEGSVKETKDKESVEQDKITLEDLLTKGDAKSMDLDSISDEEFNFDD